MEFLSGRTDKHGSSENCRSPKTNPEIDHQMENTTLDQAAAKRLINSLKKGSTPLDLAVHLNVGNEKWYSAAEEFYADVEADGDSIVRFINGYYGDGKTHFLGILRS